MNEPSLSCAPANEKETYRFLLLETWGHPLAVRITREPNKTRIVAIQLSGAGGYEPGHILQRVQRSLDDREWIRLASELDRVKYWTIPTNPPEDDIGADGSQWIIEASRGNQYHVVDRWTPETGPVRDLGLLFVQLADFAREVRK